MCFHLFETGFIFIIIEIITLIVVLGVRSSILNRHIMLIEALSIG